MVSPAGFSVSVHNSAAGMLSIHHKNTSAITSIAAGEKSLKMGLVEAVSQVRQCKKVLMIYADEKLPEIYSQFTSSSSFPACLIMTITNDPADKIIDTEGKCNFEEIVERLAH